MTCPASVTAFKYIAEESLRTALNAIRNAVIPILDRNLFPHFTNHNVEHSDELVRLIDLLITRVQGGEGRLSDKELFVLYAACYLHDAGMQFERADETECIRSLDLSPGWKDLTDQRRRDLLRQHHGEISAEMICLSATQAYPPLGIFFREDWEPTLVACLCAGHTTSITSPRYAELMAAAPSSARIDLLSGLLRVADILDESHFRAPAELARILQLDVEAQCHWWRHYYTEDVVVEPTAGTITICYDLPPQVSDEYRKVVPELQMPHVTDEIERHRPAFARAGLGWMVRTEVRSKPYSTKQELPSAVLTEMKKSVLQMRADESARLRMVAVEEFIGAQPVFLRRIAEVEAEKERLGPADYLRRLFQVARELWQCKAYATALRVLGRNLARYGGLLPAEEQLGLCIELSRMQLESDRADEALTTLEEAKSGLAGQVGGELAVDFWGLLGRCLLENARIAEAIEALDRTLELTPDMEHKSRLRVLKAEVLALAFNQGPPS